jgi:hypothetical protein
MGNIPQRCYLSRRQTALFSVLITQWGSRCDRTVLEYTHAEHRNMQGNSHCITVIDVIQVLMRFDYGSTIFVQLARRLYGYQ